MPKALKWGLLVLCVPLILAAFVGVLAVLRGDAWKARAVEAVSEQLAGELDVNEITLSWWNGFPNISVDLTNVALMSAQRDTVVLAHRVGLELNLWSVIGDAPELTSVTLEGGHVNLVQDAFGKWNIMTLLAQNSGMEDSHASLTVPSLFWKDLELQWHMSDGMEGSMVLEQAWFALGDSLQSLDWRMSASDVRIQGQDVPELLPFPMSTQGEWSATAAESWSSTGSLTVGGVDATWFLNSSSPNSWDGRLTCSEVTQSDVEALMAEVPWDGEAQLDHQLRLDIQFQPDDVQVRWSASRAAFQLAPQCTGLTMALQGVCAGQGWVRQSQGTWSWEVDELEASGPGWSLEGSVTPVSSQRLRVQGKAAIDASTPFHSWLPNMTHDVVSVLPQSGRVSGSGSLVWDVERGIESMLGRVALNNLEGSLDGVPYVLNAPEIRMNSTTCETDTLEFQWAGNKGAAKVRDLNWSTLAKGGPANGELFVRAQSIHVAPILSWWEHLNRPPSTTAELLPAGSSLKVNVESDALEWDALLCTELSAKTRVTHNRWIIQSAQIKGLEGHAHVEGSLAPGRAGWALTLRGSADDVSLPKLFSTYQNFDQTLIRHEHLGGALSLAGTLGMSWDLAGDWHGEHFTASLQTTIDHGRLKQLEVFDEIADYLKSHRLLMAPLVDPEDLRSRLKDVQFDPVSQQIEVQQKVVTLPMTVIQSSAMNVAIEGTYDFDSNIDYTLGFALRDLRASASDAFGEMEDDGLGNQFFLKMAGPVDEPVYSYDREAAKKHRRDAIQAEKTRLRDALRQRNDPDTESEETPEAPTTGSSSEPSNATQSNPSSEPSNVKPSLLDRVKKPKGKKEDDLLNPDDEDYL